MIEKLEKLHVEDKQRMLQDHGVRLVHITLESIALLLTQTRPISDPNNDLPEDMPATPAKFAWAVTGEVDHGDSNFPMTLVTSHTGARPRPHKQYRSLPHIVVSPIKSLRYRRFNLRLAPMQSAVGHRSRRTASMPCPTHNTPGLDLHPQPHLRWWQQSQRQQHQRFPPSYGRPDEPDCWCIHPSPSLKFTSRTLQN